MSKVVFRSGLKETAKCFLILGERDALTPSNGKLMKALPEFSHPYLEAIRERRVDCATAFYKNSSSEMIRYSFFEISNERNRNTGCIRSDCVYNILNSNKPKETDVQVIFALQDKKQAFPAGCAASRAYQLYNRKKDACVNYDVQIGFSLQEELPESLYTEIQAVADSVRATAELVDTPCAELNTTDYIQKIKDTCSKFDNISCEVISGEKQLKEKNLMGIWSVGKASVCPPALVILKYVPKKKVTDSVVALVGKGIMYDSGGLSLKPASSMAGMKADMAGSAACLNALSAAAKLNYGGEILVFLCLAENCIGPGAQRVDDIYTGHSGVSVEVTNTDAEGRLVLGDGVSYATTEFNPDYLIDIATLTGAQLYVTGSQHAGLMSPSQPFEDLIFKQGQESGDWCFPMIYIPELLNKGYSTSVADMRNTAKDNSNGAHSSCAGNFIERHINKSWKGKWAHLDIAAPSHCDSRATGYGTSLLLKTLFAISQS